MSKWTAPQQPHIAGPRHGSRPPARTASPAQQQSQKTARGGSYTIAHAGRQVRLGPVAFWIAVGSLVVMASWSIVTATYFAFHDDVVKTLLARQAAQQYAYEDRIAELRAEIDRTTSRQLVDQEQLDHKLDELARRQATLESRADMLSSVTDPTATGSIEPVRGGEIAHKRAPPAPRPAPHLGRQSSIAAKLLEVEASLDRVERRQDEALQRLAARYEGKTRQVRSVLDSLGLKFHAVPAAVGGPFVPVRLPPASEGFARAVTRVNIARARVADLNRTLGYVPLRKPLGGALEETSPFGIRIDPFLHQPSMHTGIDLRGAVGEPVRATAAGTVAIAGWDGGYGRMIEIDHGEGLATRYGHLSEIDVTVGQKVRAGEIIGRVGSTGRSTGPHLHYEVRVNGEAVNPERFILAGNRLFGGQIIARIGRGDNQD